MLISFASKDGVAKSRVVSIEARLVLPNLVKRVASAVRRLVDQTAAPEAFRAA